MADCPRRASGHGGGVSILSLQSAAMSTTNSETPINAKPAEDWLAIVREKTKSLKFGVVQIVVHDSRVVQIERTERIRFESPKEGGVQP